MANDDPEEEESNLNENENLQYYQEIFNFLKAGRKPIQELSPTEQHTISIRSTNYLVMSN